eukprot:COSAG02_NODE_261_length_26663_cov_210.330899_14_plen_151_part_00
MSLDQEPGCIHPRMRSGNLYWYYFGTSRCVIRYEYRGRYRYVMNRYTHVWEKYEGIRAKYALTVGPPSAGKERHQERERGEELPEGGLAAIEATIGFPRVHLTVCPTQQIIIHGWVQLPHGTSLRAFYLMYETIPCTRHSGTVANNCSTN